MNIKKLFAVLAGVSMLATQLIPAGALAATYSAELEGAYDWAYANGVTTMSPIDNANMYGAISRAEMAKMLSVYAEEVLGKSPDTARACNFTDIDSVKGDLHDFIIESCRLGIMGQGITEFRPYATLSRAEFGTALSRLLYGSKYEGGTPYYANHLQALKADGIMNQIANAEQTKEVRGYVMLMLQRSAENGATTNVDCDDPLVKLACATDSKECPAACRSDAPVVVKAGDLAVRATAAEGRRALVSTSGAVSDLDTLTFKTSEDVTITKVVLERYGYSSANDVDAVWLEDEDGNVIAEEKSLSKDKVTLSIKKDYRSVDGSYVATVVVRLTGNNVGGTIGFKVVDVESTAKKLNLDNYAPYTYDMVNYVGNRITVTVKGSDKDYNYEEGESYEIARFQVRAGDSIVYVKGFTLTNDATKALDMAEFLDKLTVKVDGENVDGLKYSVNKDDELVISFDELTVEMNKSKLFVISASLEDFDDYGDAVKYYFKRTSDVNAVEKKTGARLDVTGTALSGALAKVHTFNGGKVKLSNTKLGKIDASQGSEWVLVAEGTITVSEPISKIGFVLNANNTWVSALRMYVNGEEFEGKRALSGTTDVKFTFNNVEISESGKIQFKLDVEDRDSVGGTITITPSFKRDAFNSTVSHAKYDNTRNYVETGDVSGSISFSEVTIQPAKATLKNSLSKDVEFLTEWTDTKVVFDGTYTAKKANINLNKFYMSGAKGVADSIAYHLYLDGEEVAYTEAYGTTAEEIFDDVEVSAGESIKVRVEAEVEAGTATGTISNVYLFLGGTDEFDKDVEYKGAKIMTMKIKESGSVKVDAEAARNTVLRTSSTEQNLAQFVVKPSNDDEWLKLDTVNFTIARNGTGDDAFGKDDVEVLFDGSEEDCTITVSGNTWTASCTDLALDLPTKGITVKVNFTSKKRGEYELALTSLNGKAQTRKFSKRFEEALVYVAKQDNRWDETVFTLGVDADDDAEVKDVKIYVGGVALTWTYAQIADVFVDGDELRVANGSSVQYIDWISYKWELDWASWSIYIQKSTYNDYFKVGDDYAKVSKAKDN